MVRVTDRFTAVGDNGKVYHVIEWTTFRSIEGSEGDTEESQGWERYETSDGESVNVLPDGTYQIVKTGVILTRV